MKTTIKEAEQLLHKAQEKCPDLTAIGLHGQGSPEWNFDELDKIKYDHLKQIQLCADWIKQCTLTKKINRSHSSYGYKHMVEHFYMDYYIGAGCFIAAAIGLGLSHLGRPDSPNLCFNLSEKSIRKLNEIAQTKQDAFYEKNNSRVKREIKRGIKLTHIHISHYVRHEGHKKS